MATKPVLMFQSGYLSVMSIPILLLVLMVLLSATELSRSLQQQWYEQNAADNLAHSAALLMARELNIIALSNRALLVNQLLLAQLTGLSSYLALLEQASVRAALATSWVPYLNAALHHLQRVMKVLTPTATRIIEAGVQFQRLIIMSLQVLQGAVRITFARLIPATLAELKQRHDLTETTLDIVHAPGIVPFPWLWWSFLSRQTSANDHERLAELMQHSKDEFTESRTYDWLKLGFIRIAKTGGSELHVSAGGQWQWQSLDTLALHLRILWWREELPWAYGHKHTGRAQRRINDSSYGDSLRVNRRTTQWALSEPKRLANSQAMAYFNRENLSNDIIPSVIVRVGRGIAKARPFFHRPNDIWARVDGLQEHPNLFNALWLAQLEPLTVQDKLVLSQLMPPGESE